MGKYCREGICFLILFLIIAASNVSQAQCSNSDILEPGFKFLTSSRGCAPFTVQIQTEYLASTSGTVYYIDWGDGTAEEQYVQTGTDGVILEHIYPNSPIECGYDIIIDASNECNPRGSVTPVETQVIVWTNDVININPQTFRVCQGFATELQFNDNSDWNCFPRDTRENDVSRWIQWIYGTGDGAIRIPGIQVNGISPGTYPYNDPDPAYNPLYPVLAPGEVSLPIQVPATAQTDIGKEFEITLKNWNQCNPYDNDIKDGDPFNPVNGDFVNGDNSPIVTNAKIVIVESPEPDFQTRAGDASGAIQNTFCIDDLIYFENLTPSISGADFAYTWEFYNNDTGTGVPVKTANNKNPTYSFSTSGVKVVRLLVKDNNAAGNCLAVIEYQVFISPLLQAAIEVTDINNNSINTDFCQSTDGSQLFDVRFHDVSYGTVTSDIRWRWEFYDQNGTIIRQEPSGGGYSSSSIGPFDMQYQQQGNYLVRLIVLDEATGCFSVDSAFVKININPTADFSSEGVCLGDPMQFNDLSTANSSSPITLWEYDINNDGITDTTFSSSTNWSYKFDSAGNYTVKLTVTSDNGCSNSIEKPVDVKSLPDAVFTSDKTSGCSELEVNLTNTSWNQSLPVAYYEWRINSGSGFIADSTQSPSDTSLNGEYLKTFTNTTSSDKDYQVLLFAKAENGCENISDTIAVTVTPGASSGFLYTNYSPFNNNCSPQEIGFAVDQKTQDLAPDDYTWIVTTSDTVIHQESTGTTPSFSYVFENSTNSTQDFEVTLQTSLNSSCSSDSTLRIKINPVPDASFTVDTLKVNCEQMQLHFEANQKGLSDYNWKMSAENTTIFSQESSQDNFTYLFDKVNSDIEIKISLTTTNMANCISEAYYDSLTIPQKNNFSASFEVTPTETSLPDAIVSITNTSTTGDWQYLWDFGDGTTSTDPNITSHTYSKSGTYLIQLTLSDGTCEKSFSQSVKVTSPPPVADFEYTPEAGCLPLKVTFSNLSEFADQFLWEFGDGDTSTLENPVHTYTTPGTYSVKLTASNDGANDIIFKQDIITVHEQPVAFFDVRPDLVYIPDMPIYTNNLSEGALSYIWDFGDGNSSEEFEPTHYYTQPGQFDITLKAYNDFCYDSMTIRGAVTARESGRVLIPNAFTPNRSGPGSAGSGENDIFLPLLANVSEFKLQVFNRWGELLFEGYNRGWDGYYNGRLSPQDVYVYKLEITFNNGDQTTKVGDVNLIR
ncbi:MAG: PKD domain-containing protein [Candidatus Cyclobacteriaceae bacterium M2_1C_046]